MWGNGKTLHLVLEMKNMIKMRIWNKKFMPIFGLNSYD